MSQPKNPTIPLVAGVDEVGRGCLAGPVVAAAVILQTACPIELRDSKQYTAKQRLQQAQSIIPYTLAYSIASASPQEIDQLNILHATLLAMQRAIEGLNPQPTHVRIDGIHAPDLSISTETVVQGDASDPSIAAASILAKVYRDELMQSLDALYPEYGFARHKGYGTAQHREALIQHGPLRHHRHSFSPVQQAFQLHAPSSSAG